MGFLSTLASVFFTNYIIFIIFRALNFKNYKKVYFIIITIFEMLSFVSAMGFAIYDLVYYINGKANVGDIAYVAFNDFSYAFGILTAYIVTILIFFRGVRLFKSRRLRKFEREMRTDSERKISARIFYISLISISVLLIVVGILALYFIKEINVFFFIFTITGVLLLILVLIHYLLNKGNGDEKPIKKGIVLFFVKYNGTYYTYRFEANKDTKIEDSLGKIGIDYILSDFGIIEKNKERFRVVGIAPSNFELSLLNGISLDKVDFDYSNAFNEFNKYQKNKVILDENGNILDVIKLKK